MVLILFLLVIIIVAGIFVFTKNKPVNNSDRFVKSIRYYYGGSSIGDSYILEFSEHTLKMSKCEGNGMDEIKKHANVDDSFVLKIDELVKDADIIKWTNLKKSDLFAYDAASASVSILFTNGKVVNFGTYDILPDGGWDIVDEIVTLMEAEIYK